VHIFSPTKDLPALTASRMLHYAIFLQQFQYDIKYRSSSANANADALSRLSRSSEELTNIQNPVDLFYAQHLNEIPVDTKAVRAATLNDAELRPVYDTPSRGRQLPPTLMGVSTTEITIENGCILRGFRIVIPTKLLHALLEEL